MANQFLKLRRSSVPGKKPDTGSLDYGEIALNTYDGLAFMKKSGSNGEEIVAIGSTGSFTGSFFGSLQGTSSWATNALTASSANNFLVRGTLTAQTIVVQVITSSTEFVTGSLIVSGALNVFGSITGSLNGTASWATNAVSSSYAFIASNAATASFVNNAVSSSYAASASIAQNALTASYVAASSVVGLSLFQIATGSITASVGLGNDLFLIKSGSKTYFNISSSGDAIVYSSNFMIRDFNTNELVFQVSASKAYFDFDGITIATQSVAPTGSANVGGVLFTSTAMYIGLE